MLVLDSGGLTRLAKRDRETAALLIALRRRGLWPPVVPTVVLAESLTGIASRDANTNRFLKTCDIRPQVPEYDARRAATLRTQAHTGSAVDAIMVAIAEPGSTILTGDTEDLEALAANANLVAIETV
jgi:predicted nucleic acid-binding protein